VLPDFCVSATDGLTGSKTRSKAVALTLKLLRIK